MRKNNKTHNGKEITVGVCNKCGKTFFDDIMPYRKYKCRECFNTSTRTSMRKKASTIEGYLELSLKTIKNDHRGRRNRYYNDIDLKFLMDLYELQEGKCALTGIKMTIGHGNGIYEPKREKIDRNPFNVSIDRIDNKKGYVKDNVVLICTCVNFFKNNLTVEQIQDTAEQIVNYRSQWLHMKSLIDTKLLHKNIDQILQTKQRERLRKAK